ncbi:MAG: hypothetical protein NVS4B6_17980 [Mycobacterium sp.]
MAGLARRDPRRVRGCRLVGVSTRTGAAQNPTGRGKVSDPCTDIVVPDMSLAQGRPRRAGA